MGVTDSSWLSLITRLHLQLDLMLGFSREFDAIFVPLLSRFDVSMRHTGVISRQFFATKSDAKSGRVAVCHATQLSYHIRELN